MVAVPAVRAVTSPFAAMVATARSLEDHTPPVVVFASVVVPATQTSVVPVMGATTGSAFTVTVVVVVATQPDALVTV